MKRIILILLTVGCICFAAVKVKPTIVEAEFVRTIDGDTIVVNVHAWPEIIGREIPIRLRGVDTPELNSKDPKLKAKAVECKELTEQICSEAKTILLINPQRGTFFRIIADIKIEPELENGISDLGTIYKLMGYVYED